ncbi:hypothetical protein C8A05DRAFT_11967 [Staphylotrichum tortipilum]|uniref:Cyclin N-terminal domain-containing protein n=1 Tax=Staphylotrichum tortipilum TaxID=2831512 RepID=A0AAN6MSE1_9PEZI|nr:hypothetical protein C8A05DRAFT_11967 [Staphylotrichum longicolle]
MATHSPDYSDDEFDFDEEYFSRTYQPLSNLPTPPPSSRESLAAQSPRTLLEDGGLLESVLLGPAIHLVNLIPPAASLTVPSVPLVHEMLVRSDLPMDTIALAVCILDSLSSKFSLSWRLLCPLAQREPSSGATKRHTIQASPRGAAAAAAQLHIDSVNPEVIVLAALMIAVKFLVDCQEPTHYYGAAWGKNMWTCEQINLTERCIMENLGYRILPLWDPVLITDAVGDMQRAARQAAALLPAHHHHHHHPRNGEAPHKRSVSSAVLLSGPATAPSLPLTPVETPSSESGPTAARGGAAKAAEFGAHGAMDPAMLHLPPRTKRKATSPVAG